MQYLISYHNFCSFDRVALPLLKLDDFFWQRCLQTPTPHPPLCWQQFLNIIRVSICTALNLSEFLNSSTTTSICFLDLFVVSDEQVKEIYKINKHYNVVLQINRFKSSFSLSRLSSFSFIIISRSSKLFTCAASLGLVATLSSSKAKLSS